MKRQNSYSPAEQLLQGILLPPKRYGRLPLRMSAFLCLTYGKGQLLCRTGGVRAALRCPPHKIKTSNIRTVQLVQPSREQGSARLRVQRVDARLQEHMHALCICPRASSPNCGMLCGSDLGRHSDRITRLQQCRTVRWPNARSELEATCSSPPDPLYSYYCL